MGVGGVLLWLCIVFSASFSVYSTLTSPWRFSLKPIKAKSGEISGSVSYPKHYTSRVEFQPRIVEVLSGSTSRKDVSDAISKLSMRSLTVKSKYGTYSQAPFIAVASIPSIILGYRNFILEFNIGSATERKCDAEVSSSMNGSFGQFVLSSLGKKTGMQLVCDVVVEENRLSIRSTVSSAGLWKREVKRIVNLIETALAQELSHELQLRIVRKEQRKTQRILSKNSVKISKAKELDKILHPEKYTRKSATVRRDAASGSGRYTPSSSTQARRQVKRS